MSITHPQRKKILNYFSMLVIIASILWAYGITSFSIRLYDNLTKIESNLLTTFPNSINMALGPESLRVIEEDIEIIGAELPKLEHKAKVLYWLTRPIFPIFKVVSIVPIIGSHAEQIEPLLNYTKNLSQASTLFIPIMDRLIELMQLDLNTAELIQQANLILLQNQAAIRQASQHLEEANRARDELDPSFLPDGIAEPIERMDKYFDQAQHLLDILSVMPSIFGSPEGKRSYLLLAQNKDELRATGGFISGIGRLAIEDGRVTAFNIDDSYSIDNFAKQYPTPPKPLHQFMLADYWLPRDANWSPDFPTAARQAQELITLSTEQTSDGVIAFDQEAVRILVEALGPLNIASFPEPIRANNIESMMQQAWAPSPSGDLSQAWWEQRKDFMSQLGAAIIEELLYTSDKELLFQLGRKLVAAIKAGHVLMYFNHQESQTMLAESGLDNGIHPGEGDFLLLVDSNIGFNKVDTLIDRQITYMVDLSDPNKPMATLIARYTHTIKEEINCVHEASYGTGKYSDLQTRCYWNYWRVYKQAGTQLYAANQTPVPSHWLLNEQDWDGRATIEAGVSETEVISGLFVLPTQQSQDINLQFLLPPSAIDQMDNDTFRYQLKLQKQAGLENLPVDIKIKLPPDYQLVTVDESWQLDPITDLWSWAGKITAPKNFSLLLAPMDNRSP